ncbi:hypothetical protein RD792_009167 [Penstemon davidsonii]|uniref:Mannan endo-1,4-beta-mannosidase n=1 Tax=Penstemon davidsonii TaxID=160366 RepID=A0ABR0DBA5_9LAMI|nr:hypothetical protein RD792_009167 [Penstemon davidsonii]
MNVVELHKAVVGELGRNKVTVILDNHISQPQWCCRGNDGNGFFGDFNFNPNEWLQGLAAVATTYKSYSACENDIDWALWTFQGSYMLREGKVNLEEVYGVIDLNWNQFPIQDQPSQMRKVVNGPNYKAISNPKGGGWRWPKCTALETKCTALFKGRAVSASLPNSAPGGVTWRHLEIALWVGDGAQGGADSPGWKLTPLGYEKPSGLEMA